MKHAAVQDQIYGTTVNDPFRWLEDSHDASVHEWATTQDELTDAYFSAVADRSSLESRVRELLSATKLGLPAKYGKKLFFERKDAEQEAAAVYTADSVGGAARAIIDPNKWDKAKHEELMGFWPSPDGKHIAYATSVAGGDVTTVHIQDVESGASLGVIENTRFFTVGWDASGTGLYYTFYPADQGGTDTFLHSVVRFHGLKAGVPDETVSDEAGDGSAVQTVRPSDGGRWIILTKTIGWTRTAISFRDAARKTPWRVLVDGVDALAAAISDDRSFYIRTNDGASNFRLFRADVSNPTRDRWSEIVPERKDAVLEDHALEGGALVLRWRKPEGSELELRDLLGRNAKLVQLPESGGLASTPAGWLHDKEAFFSFESYVRPTEIFHLDLTTGTARSVEKVHAAVDMDQFVVDKVPYAAKDGTPLFLFLARRKSAQKDGQAPVLLEGYGAFGISVDPTYRSTLPAFLERGGIYAEAVMRGGGEYGETWHRAATGANKQRSFDDLIAAAEELIRLGWAKPERLGIFGSSAGGLAALAVITQRPELFRYAVAEAPLTDMIRYPLSGLGKRWTAEFGDPGKPDEFKSVLGWSPYHNVHPGVTYPATLFFQPEDDDRVDPMHTRKMVAELQASATKGPILLDVERNMAHHAIDSRSLIIKVKTDEYAFIFDQCRQRDAAH